jgi:hypothetical protein
MNIVCGKLRDYAFFEKYLKLKIYSESNNADIIFH